MGGGSFSKKKNTNNQDENREGGLRGKAPDIFDGDRSKSKAFTTDLKIYLQLNRNKPDIKNRYFRVLLALSFIKGPNVVSWVKAQVDLLDKDLAQICGGDENDNDLWTEFEKKVQSSIYLFHHKRNSIRQNAELKNKGGPTG